MYQGEQEHPQIFLARLREAADLAGITQEPVIESRFRAGLLREIKQFCIQSSSKTMQDWINHSEGWWNANRPRKIAMVDNPFIPRNANQALIYQNDAAQHYHHMSNNHNIDLVDTNEHSMPALTLNQIHYNNAQPTYAYHDNVLGTNQLVAMDTSRNRNQARHVQANGHRSINTNQQQDLVELIQQTIRQELNKQQTYNHPNRNYNRYNRYNNNNDNYNNHNSRYGRSNGNMDNNTGSNRNGLAYSNDHRNQQRYNNGNQPQQPQQNDQRHFQQHKSIKHENSQHQLNVILSDIETNYDPSQIELCAAIRPERPPDVTTATPYNKIKPTSKPKGKHPTLARKVVTRSHLGEIQPVSNQQNTSQHDINMDTDLPIQDRETIKQKRTRTKSEPTLIQYDIVSDLQP
ncbi:hypothetical protein G6F21_012826 [Rhizopus arrhizus]|nr:hypothetical protein G6F21_012826 [Rhizopus arrhizus]